MVWRKSLGYTLLTVGLALVAGCGAGTSGTISDFFGTGTSPGTSATTEQGGTVQGVILRRDRDGRILILGSAAEATEAATPVVGAVVAIPELSLAGTTGATGSYRFTQVTPGDLTLRITLPAALGGTTANFQFRLDPGETISGLPAGVNQ